MEPPLSTKKRVHMDPDVVEIPPTTPPTPNSQSVRRKLKNKQVMPQEVIDVDMDEDFTDVIVLDEIINTKTKGKSINNYSNGIKQSKEAFTNNFSKKQNFKVAEEGAASNTIIEDQLSDIQKKFELFKKFDTVQDHSDHYYDKNGSSVKQPPKSWAKRIQDEWKILEKNLPDAIFVRVYETRMDLMRAVIVGADGTPYQDGLFFFDISFPGRYPNVPPHVHYHSGGLRINPNLYNCGKVCLSLLGTWHGNKNESWVPGVSTVLQVLVSIQALILNQEPFFNEPGYVSMRGTRQGEQRSLQYNENILILSLTTMVYTMKKPPKHFEDFVVGHFDKSARGILASCKAYMEGVQVGCLVKGGVQDVDEGEGHCSDQFKSSLPGYVDMLRKQFKLIGVENIGES